MYTQTVLSGHSLYTLSFSLTQADISQSQPKLLTSVCVCMITCGVYGCMEQVTALRSLCWSTDCGHKEHLDGCDGRRCPATIVYGTGTNVDFGRR